ncbi:unnamed protein product, partial [Pelagomonas calceolata]
TTTTPGSVVVHGVRALRGRAAAPADERRRAAGAGIVGGQRLLEAVVVLAELADEAVETRVDEELGDVALDLGPVEIQGLERRGRRRVAGRRREGLRLRGGRELERRRAVSYTYVAAVDGDAAAERERDAGGGVRLARHRDARRPREDELEEALGLADEDGAVEAGGALRYLRAALALQGDVRPALEGYLGHGYGTPARRPVVNVLASGRLAPRRRAR